MAKEQNVNVDVVIKVTKDTIPVKQIVSKEDGIVFRVDKAVDIVENVFKLVNRIAHPD